MLKIFLFWINVLIQLSGRLIHHFPNPENLLNEVARILKNGRYLFTQDPNILNPKVFISRARFSPFRKVVTVNENPITPFYLKRLLRNKFQMLKAEYFSFVPPQWILSNSLQNKYLMIEKLLQKIPLKYLFADLLSVSRKTR